MGVKEVLIRFLRRGKSSEQRFEAMQSDVKALQSVETTEYPEQSAPIEIQRDSLQLGIAAGYTGQSIRTIETSLNRIELQMATKDWVTANFQGTLDILLNMQKNNQDHMENMRKRLENIENIVKIMEDNPIFHKIKGQQEEMTAKMREALGVIELSGEISYDDLAARLGVSVSSLRGLLSVIARRTDRIKRFEKDSKGWVSFVINSDSKRFESEQPGEIKPNSDASNPENGSSRENTQ